MPNVAVDYWRSFESTEPLTDLAALLDFLEDSTPAATKVVWRGVANEAWPLHSSLYRWVVQRRGGSPAQQAFDVDENLVVQHAREWGLDRVPSPRSGLELLAWMQHTGTPTRLIDVTWNPLVAAWFACDVFEDEAGDEVDGRLFAIASTNSLLVDDGEPALPWSTDSDNGRQLRENRTSLWTPPALDPRIAAQSGAFLIGPLPRRTSGGNWYNSGESDNRYSAAEVRALTSIPIRAYQAIQPGTIYRQNPLISVRVAASAKAHLRERLAAVFNLDTGRLFPDPHGLAMHVRQQGGP